MATIVEAIGGFGGCEIGVGFVCFHDIGDGQFAHIMVLIICERPEHDPRRDAREDAAKRPGIDLLIVFGDSLLSCPTWITLWGAVGMRDTNKFRH